MQVFDLLFPLFMIGFPAVMARCLRTKEFAGSENAVRMERRLWSITGICMAVVVGLWIMRQLCERQIIPVNLPDWVWKVIPSALLAQAGFFLLWFRYAMPLIREYRPEMDAAPSALTGSEQPAVRSASLTPRQPPSALHTKSAIWTLGLWFTGFALFLYAWKTHGVPEGKSTTHHLFLCAMGLVAALSVALVIPLGHRTMFLSPEPLHADRSPELKLAQRKFEVFKGRAILGLILAIIAAILLIPLSLAFHWRFTGPEWGLIGGGLGALGGIMGGVVGTMMSLYRLKIQRIEQSELEGQTP